ncbi:MAG: UDP-N-acetylmuramate--L-alanine ligase [Lentisphaerae bacterium GWF2_57_35]|nr:MAG: UDP-N-acetylmuramate--L-alanine ligase [Lentisphaerae bacterium GWF2_57_35]
MAGLAYHLYKRGFEVSGCDVSFGRTTEWLAARGIPVEQGHHPAHVERDIDWLIRSAAVPENSAELTAARARGLPIFNRGWVLPLLLEGAYSIAVSGTHGKTTTTAMIAQVFMTAGRDPSYCVGGEWNEGRDMAGVGAGNVMIVEADESDGTVELYAPDVAVITNIEYDHMENFRSEEALVKCFRTFAGKAQRTLVYGEDDSRARQVCGTLEKGLSFGLLASARVRGLEVVPGSGAISFDVTHDGVRLGRVALQVPGIHNVQNALAACAVALASGISFEDIRRGLNAFQAVRRRFERVLDNEDWLVISDYSHHPTEIRALVQAARGIGRKRIVAVFQPHRFTRTKALGADFPPSFEGIDALVLAPVYAASEASLPGGASSDLLALFDRFSTIPVLLADSLPDAWAKLRPLLRKGDLLLVIGAGDVEKVAGWAKNALE